MPFFDLILNKKFIVVFVLIISATVYINYSTWVGVYAQKTGSQNEAKDPVISIPDTPVIAEATGPEGSLVSYTVSATNVAGSSINANCTPQSDTIFALGTTKVDCTAVDEAGNDVRASFNVLVEDTTPLPPSLGLVKRTGWV